MPELRSEDGRGMSVLVKGWSIPTDGCCSCYFRTGKYCGILSKNERVLEYAERFTRPDNCPLTELIQCKDCKHRDPEDKKCDCGHTIRWQLPRSDMVSTLGAMS